MVENYVISATMKLQKLVKEIKTLWKEIFFSPIEKRFYHFLLDHPISSEGNSEANSNEVIVIEFSKIYHNIIGLYFFLKELSISRLPYPHADSASNIELDIRKGFFQ